MSDNPSPAESSPSFSHYLWGKPNTVRFWLGVIVTAVVILAVPLTLLAVRNQQNIGSSASSCNQEPVNVEFRKNTSENPDKPWKSGEDVNIKIGDVLEVNCFAENGTKLLATGKITGKVGGETIDLAALSDYFDGVQVRGYDVTKAGTYVFECKNANNKCKDSDTFTVAGGASPSPSASASASPSASPTATPTTSPSPSPACSTYSPSDLNKDCHSTIQDYDLFLRDFIEQQE